MADKVIDLKRIENSDAPAEVLEVYKRVKRDFVDDADRKTWQENRRKNWAAAYPLDLEKDGIWTAEEKEKMIAKGMIPIAKNYLARDIQGSSALITSKSPGLLFMPIGEGDLYVAELFKRGWDYIVSSNDLSVILYDWVKEKNIGNLGVIEAKYNPSLGIFGKIVILDMDPTTYYFDKRSKTRDHSDVCFGKAHQVTKNYALETYEDLTEEDLKFTPISKDKDDTGSVPDGKPGQDAYAVDTNESNGQSGPEDNDDDKENIWEIEDWEYKREREIWLMIPDESQAYGFERKVYKDNAAITKDGWEVSADKKQATKAQPPQMAVVDASGVPVPIPVPPIQALLWPRLVTKRIQRIVIGKKMVSKTVNPLGVDAEGAPVLPIITLQADKTLQGYPTGPTSRALESNRAHNKRDMQAIYIASKNVDPPWTMPAGCKWVKDEIHGDYIEVSKDAAFPPTPHGPQNNSSEVMNLAQKDQQDIHDEYGINDIIQGKIPVGQSNMAHRTVLALQEMVGVISSPSVLTFEGALVKLGRAVAALMLMVWPRPMWQRLIEAEEMGTWQPDKEKQVDKDGTPMKPEAGAINQKWNDALDKLTGENGKVKTDLIDIDVKIFAGSTQPTNRMAKRGEAIELVKAGIYDQEAYLDYTDDPKKDEITERRKQSEKGQQTPEKVNVTINFKDMPPEAQAQLAQQIGIQMNPGSALPADTGAA
jgi:hypothetical protein